MTEGPDCIASMSGYFLFAATLGGQNMRGKEKTCWKVKTQDDNSSQDARHGSLDKPHSRGRPCHGQDSRQGDRLSIEKRIMEMENPDRGRGNKSTCVTHSEAQASSKPQPRGPCTLMIGGGGGRIVALFPELVASALGRARFRDSHWSHLRPLCALRVLGCFAPGEACGKVVTTCC